MKAEVYLVKNKLIFFTFAAEEIIIGGVRHFNKGANVTLDRVKIQKPDDGEGSAADNILFSMLKDFLETPRGLEWNRDLKVSFRLRDTDTLKVRTQGLSWIREALKDLGHGYNFQFEISDADTDVIAGTRNSKVQKPGIGTGILAALEDMCIGHEFRHGVYDENFLFPSAWYPKWGQSNLLFTAQISLKVFCDIPIAGPANNIEIQWVGSFDAFSITKKLLKESIETDMTIISEGGFTHPCHKSFLIAHSPAIGAMFQNNWEEAIDNTITMKDVSKDAVDGVLAYLYYWDLEMPYKDLNVAREMFLVANKYLIQSLESSVAKLILHQPAKRFPVEATFRLYLTVKRCELPFGDELEIKTLQIMAAKSEELLSLPEYTSLVRDDPDLYSELSKALIRLNRDSNDKVIKEIIPRWILVFDSLGRKFGLPQCKKFLCFCWGLFRRWARKYMMTWMQMGMIVY